MLFWEHTIRPTSSHVLWGGAVEIHCFGRPRDWKLRGSSLEEALENDPDALHGLMTVADELGIDRLYMPNPSKFNGLIVRPENLTDEWLEDRLYRGVFADGVLLTEPGQAFAVASADCPTAVVHDPISGHVVAAHAGLKSLLETEAENPLAWSIYQALEGAVGRDNLVPKHVCGFITCGIGPGAYHFDPGDAGYTVAHERQVEEVCRVCSEAVIEIDGGCAIDLALLFRHQLEQQMVAMESVGFDGVCTHDDIGRDGKPLWHSHRRGDASRNLIVVIRR